MSLKDILVHVDSSREAPTTLAAACALARDSDAHLTGLTVDRPPEIPGYAAIEIPASALEIIQAQRKQAADKAREMFDKAVAAAGITDRSRWALAKGMPLETLSLRARYTDLVVVSQSDPEQEHASAEDLVDDLILVSGRPVLVVPYIGAPDRIGKKILVAWNASREAARAVADAMPILESAESVEVIAVEPNGIGDAPGADIAEHLARHGVNATASKTTGLDIEVGDVLLNHIADSGADMMVMGAYGHSRMRELVLGGATRHILQHMTVPVLLSH
ncbi:MAG: universal stress protein [Rhodospirillales bacterium]|nr:MAG: universal stress protein [Rhodospirillales bacterium]